MKEILENVLMHSVFLSQVQKMLKAITIIITIIIIIIMIIIIIITATTSRNILNAKVGIKC